MQSNKQSNPIEVRIQRATLLASCIHIKRSQPNPAICSKLAIEPSDPTGRCNRIKQPIRIKHSQSISEFEQAQIPAICKFGLSKRAIQSRHRNFAIRIQTNCDCNRNSSEFSTAPSNRKPAHTIAILTIPTESSKRKNFYRLQSEQASEYQIYWLTKQPAFF